MGMRKISKKEYERTLDLYFMWKHLNIEIKKDYSRGVNLHECITEKICCYINNFQSSLGKGSEDAYDPIQNNKIQVKGTSNWDKDLTSFGPDSEFDELHFARLDQESDRLYFYNIPVDNIYNIKVNKQETFREQQQDKRRPRFSIIKKIINNRNLKPYVEINLATGDIWGL